MMDEIDAFALMLIIIIGLCIVFVFEGSVNSTDIVEKINITYDVREVHIGVANGMFYDVVYIDGNNIKNIILSPERVQIYRTDGSAKLVWLVKTRDQYYNEYALYIPDNMSFTGQLSEYHSGKHTEQSVIY